MESKHFDLKGFLTDLYGTICETTLDWAITVYSLWQSYPQEKNCNTFVEMIMNYQKCYESQFERKSWRLDDYHCVMLFKMITLEDEMEVEEFIVGLMWLGPPTIETSSICPPARMIIERIFAEHFTGQSPKELIKWKPALAFKWMGVSSIKGVEADVAKNKKTVIWLAHVCFCSETAHYYRNVCSTSFENVNGQVQFKHVLAYSYDVDEDEIVDASPELRSRYQQLMTA